MQIIASVCNNKQRQDKDKCRFECKELIEKGMCDKEFIWNKSCNVGEYLGHENCKCRKTC